MADQATDTRVLWQEFKRTGDRGLRDRLILTYAPLVKYVAGRLGSGLPAHVDEGDLVSYGLLGLIGAIERFDPARDIKFETYAIARIKGSIIDELRSMDGDAGTGEFGHGAPLGDVKQTHGSEKITDICITTGFSAGTNLSALLRSWEINSKDYAFGL